MHVNFFLWFFILYFFKKPCVILRPQTEWVEIVETGSAVITDANKNKILASSPGIKKELMAVLKNVKPLKGEMFGAPEVTNIGT